MLINAVTKHMYLRMLEQKSLINLPILNLLPYDFYDDNYRRRTVRAVLREGVTRQPNAPPYCTLTQPFLHIEYITST